MRAERHHRRADGAPGGPTCRAVLRADPREHRGSNSRERGQASVELLGALPALIVLGMVLFQALAVGYAAVLAGNAAEAAALALAGDADPRAAARAAVPGWSRAGMSVAAGEERVRVTLRPPSPVEAVRDKLAVSSEAAVAVP